MTLTTEMLVALETEMAGGPVSLLRQCEAVVRQGIEGASPEVLAHGKALLLKLDHLMRMERAGPVRSSDVEEYLAPWLTLHQDERAAA